MTKAILIEDEAPAMRVMTTLLSQEFDNVSIVAKLTSVEEALNYFSASPSPADIIFSDVMLGDGLSFEIFLAAKVTTPVVFITGYDRFMLQAFENNGIAYLLKPVETDDLKKALEKYASIRSHFDHQQAAVNTPDFKTLIGNQPRTRLIAKRGREHVVLRLSDIVLFYTEHKLVYVLDKDAKKYILDDTLTQLEQDLDSRRFFRANRQYIVNLDYVKGFKPIDRVKIVIDLEILYPGHSIVVSQESAPVFKEWLRNA